MAFILQGLKEEGEGLEVAQAGTQLGRWLQGLGMPLLKRNRPKHAAAWQHWHSPLHSAGMQEPVEKCLHQYSSFWSGKGNKGLRTRTCVNITVLAKPEFGRKTNVAFIKPLCMPGPEKEAQPAGRRAVGTKLTQELEAQLFLPAKAGHV